MKKILSTILLVVFMFVAMPVLAATPLESGLNTAAKTAKLIKDEDSSKSAQELTSSKIGDFIKAIISLVGVVFMLVVIYGGFIWMTAGGNAEAVKKGRNYVINAAIGIAIISLSYALTSYLITTLGSQVGKATSDTGTTSGTPADTGAESGTPPDTGASGGTP